jgi:hypothetical protein
LADYKARFGRKATAQLKAHLKRDLYHGTWALLIDAEFIKAYENGIEIKFADGITRLVFPRFITYSADYPERYACVI